MGQKKQRKRRRIRLHIGRPRVQCIISRVALRFWASVYFVPFQVIIHVRYMWTIAGRRLVCYLQQALAVSRRVVSLFVLYFSLCASLWYDSSTRLAHGCLAIELKLWPLPQDIPFGLIWFPFALQTYSHTNQTARNFVPSKQEWYYSFILS